MALKLPVNFRRDIQGKDTSLFPLVVIGNIADGQLADPTDWIMLSTNQYSWANPAMEPTTAVHRTLPLLLDVPSLKESIDIEKRNYKISSLNISISNFPYKDKRFSELISDSSLINIECRVFWVSPSTNKLVFWDEGASTTPGVHDNAFFQTYFGNIRRYTHDDEKVRLVVEDKSQATLHRDLPLPDKYENGTLVQQNWLGIGEGVPDKYKNKPIPMVYGHVDRSPCVFKTNAGTEDVVGLEILADIEDSETRFNTGARDWFRKENLYSIITDPLWIYYNDKYFNVLEDSRITNVPGSVGFHSAENPDGVVNYSGFNYFLPINSAQIQLYPTTTNAVKDGLLEVGILRLPTSILTRENLYEDGNSTNNGATAITNSTFSNIENISKPTADFTEIDVNMWESQFALSAPWDFEMESIWLFPRFDPIDDDKLIYLKHYLLHDFRYEVTAVDNGNYNENAYDDFFAWVQWLFQRYKGEEDSYYVDDRYSMPGGLVLNEIHNTLDESAAKGMTLGKSYWANNLHWSSTQLFEEADEYMTDGWDDIEIPLMPEGFYGQGFLSTSFTVPPAFKLSIEQNDPWSGSISAKLGGVAIYNVALLHGIIEDHSYYANVKGRTNSSTAPNVIGHILNNELGLDQTIPSPELPSVDEDGSSIDPFIYAFTIDKKINSKKLIEGLASVSPYIPRFNNLGKFKFDVIKEKYDITSNSVLTDAGGNETIKEADVIDFSFKRTPIDKVYTKVEFKYNWDYARGEFDNNIIVNIDDSISTLIGLDYDYDYYGLKDDHSESTLTIDDDRGKYIRDSSSAEAFARWMLSWSIHQHLIMKVKLPLKYMNLEIGDIIGFEEILGNVNPYGIVYSSVHFIPNKDGSNGQALYPYFMVTSTNKTLEHVDLECIQMHNISTIPEVFGCMDMDACNYNLDATVDDGSCYYQNDDNLFNYSDGSYKYLHRDCDGNCIDDEDNDNICDQDDDCETGTGAWDECGNCGLNGMSPDGDPWDCQVDGNCWDFPNNVCDCEGNFWDGCGVCNGDGTSCEQCNHPYAINYDPNATNPTGCHWVSYDSDLCYYEEIEGFAQSNYICNPYLAPNQSCVSDGDGTFSVGEGVWNLDDYGPAPEHEPLGQQTPGLPTLWEQVHAYCAESWDTGTGQCDPNNQYAAYPKFLSKQNCALVPGGQNMEFGYQDFRYHWDVSNVPGGELIGEDYSICVLDALPDDGTTDTFDVLERFASNVTGMNMIIQFTATEAQTIGDFSGRVRFYKYDELNEWGDSDWFLIGEYINENTPVNPGGNQYTLGVWYDIDIMTDVVLNNLSVSPEYYFFSEMSCYTLPPAHFWGDYTYYCGASTFMVETEIWYSPTIPDDGEGRDMHNTKLFTLNAYECPAFGDLDGDGECNELDMNIIADCVAAAYAGNLDDCLFPCAIDILGTGDITYGGNWSTLLNWILETGTCYDT